ncbi:MAG: alkaline phosphatase family protein [Lentisphaerae bacterium]|nr:alkaline phosphatase family protein [Lentisphaerota bacterium]
MRILMLFVDGLGLGVEDAGVNPLHSGACPALDALLREHAVPADAGLGVAGPAQSATGQTALLTGVNAPRLMGRHIEGFPGPTLVRVIRERNLFRRILAAGRRCTFANAYYVDDEAEVRRAPFRSVTTVAALSAFGRVRKKDALARNAAVYQDLTRESLAARGYRGPCVTPAEAAGHLAALAGRHDMTLFEYFQTDRAGHRADAAAARNVLAAFDAFLEPLLEQAERGAFTLLLTSDHGNIEDLRVRGHTRNPVPFAALGEGAAALRGRVARLTDIADLVVESAAT